MTDAPAGRVGGDAHMAFSSLTSGPQQRGKPSLRKDQEVLAQFYRQVTHISAWPQTETVAFAMLVTLFYVVLAHSLYFSPGFGCFFCCLSNKVCGGVYMY